jgi:putative ABC transport system substrate-binding protein
MASICAGAFTGPASFVDKLLKGVAPGESPIEFPTRMMLAVNRKTASALGIAVPPTLLGRADEVIE